MYQTHRPADIRSAAPTFNVTWRAALKSERFAPRRKLISGLRVAIRRDTLNKSIWSWPRRPVDLALLKLLEWEMRLNKAAVFKQFAAKAAIGTKANGGDRS
jgi:hypothetical protein